MRRTASFVLGRAIIGRQSGKLRPSAAPSEFPLTPLTQRDKSARIRFGRGFAAGRRSAYMPRHVHSSVARYRAAQVAADHGRLRPGGRRRADQRPDHDQHADRGRDGDDRPDPPLRGSRARTSSACPARPPRATAALKEIVRAASVPIVADIHFHYKRALEAADAGAACLRINPGNIGSEERVREVIAAARANGCAIRIGVNAGSLEKDLLEKYGEPCPEALVESALDHIRILEDHGFREYKVAVKASDVFLAVAAYQQLASRSIARSTLA